MITKPSGHLSRSWGNDFWLIAVGVALMTLVALLGGCETAKKSTVSSPSLAKQASAAPQG